MVIVGEFIGGAALGAAFGLLFDVVQKAVDKPTTFKSLLENIKFSLDFLKPVIEKIGQHNVELGLPDEEIKYLVKEMEEGVKLVQKSSKVSKWNCMKSYYTDQLIELDGSLKRLLHILMVQGVRDAKETLILARKHQDQLIESARDAKETLVLAQKNTDQLIESAEDGKETLVLARQNADQLNESARDGKETLVLTRQNNDQLVASARDGKETLVLARKIKRLLKQIERLVPCTNKGKTRYHSGNRVSKVSKSAGRSQIIDDQCSTNIVSDTSSSAGTCTSLLKTPTFQKDDQSTDDHISETSNLRVFSFAELKNATRNFREDTVLGEGGFGRVFKGWLDEKTLAPSKAGSGMIVAIKKRKPESLQGFEQWMSEVNILGRLSHFNIVKLLGFCSETDELLLVYEYMQKGSLENHLFRRSPNFEPLSWDSRIKIAIGAARGLAFLHSPENQVIYRDFKTSTILIDGNYNAKLSGFGLAKLGPIDGDSHVSTRVIGTYGYAAPEYLATGHLYVKSDVYGFGVVLLEILTGLRVLDRKRPEEQLNLVDWTKPLLPHKRKLKAIMDARMEGQYSFKAAIQTANITLKCLAPDPQSRPSMKEVLEELEQIQAIRENPKPSVLITSRKPTSTPRSYVLQEPGRRILNQESGPDKYHATE